MGQRSKIESYIKEWEKKCYTNGIPDEAPIEIEKNLLAPSYRMICMCIMKNDFNLKYLGQEQNKSYYYDILKKDELILRGITVQLKLNL